MRISRIAMITESDIERSIEVLERRLSQKREELENLRKNPPCRLFAFSCNNLHAKIDEIIYAMQEFRNDWKVGWTIQLVTCHFILKHGNLSDDKASIVRSLFTATFSQWKRYFRNRNPFEIQPDDLEREPFTILLEKLLTGGILYKQWWYNKYDNFEDRWYEFEESTWLLAPYGGKLYFTDSMTPLPLPSPDAETMIFKCRRDAELK